MWQSQRALIASSNFLVTFWWAADVALAWARRDGRWRSVPRTLIHLLAFVTFAVSSLVLFGGAVRILGAAMTAAVAVSLGARLFRRSHPARTAPAEAAA